MTQSSLLVFARRSVADVRNGRPGILVMPKISPLEGDTSSSLKSKKGEWWQKMKSASQFVPRVTIAHLSSDLLRIRVSNPRHNRLNVWIGPGKQDLSSDHLICQALPLASVPLRASSHGIGWVDEDMELGESIVLEVI